MRLRVLWVVALVAGGVLPVRAEDSYVKRGVPQRQGRLWVEQAECSVPVKEGGRLVFRAAKGVSHSYRVLSRSPRDGY